MDENYWNRVPKDEAVYAHQTGKWSKAPQRIPVIANWYEVRHPWRCSAVLFFEKPKKSYTFVDYGSGTRMTYANAMDFIRSRTDPRNWMPAPVFDAEDEAEYVYEKEEQKEVLMEGIELKKNKTVGVEYSGDNKVYNFQVLPALGELELEEWVVVQTGETGFTIGKVVEIHAVPARNASKFVFQRVDTVTNDRLVTLRNEGKQLFARLQDRVQEIQRKRVLDDIVANDPEGSAILAQLREMGAF